MLAKGALVVYSRKTEQDYQDPGVTHDCQVSTISRGDLPSTPAYLAALAVNLTIAPGGGWHTFSEPGGGREVSARALRPARSSVPGSRFRAGLEP